MKRVFVAIAATVLLSAHAGARAESSAQIGGYTLSHATARLSQARHWAVGGAVGSSAFFCGGSISGSSDVVDLYNPTAERRWSSSQRAGEGVDPLSKPRYVASVASSGNRLFVAGGGVGTAFPDSTVDIYDATGARVGHTYITGLAGNGRLAGASASADGKVFFAGGDSNAGSASNPGNDWMQVSVGTVDVIDATTLNHSVMSLSTPRSYLMGASVGHEVLFAGGEYTPLGGNVYYNSSRVDIYNTQLGSWSTAELSVARFSGAGATAGGKAMFAGGAWEQDHAQRTAVTSAAVDIYDSSSGLWSTSSLSQARVGLGGAGVGDLALFGGGWNETDGFSDVVDVYDSTNGTWSALHLSQARAQVQAVVVGNQVLFAGGYYTEGGVNIQSDVVDIFTLTPVPEPSSLLAFLSGAAGMCGLTLKRRK